MTSHGIGERLRNAREARGLSLEEIEAGTRIRRRYLEALEAEAFDEIPGAAYVKGFLRTYATYLGFSPDDLAALSPDISPGMIVPPGSLVEVRITPVGRRPRVRQIVVGIVLVVVIALALVGYTLYGQIRQFAISRPQISSGSHLPASRPTQPGSSGASRSAPGPAASPSPPPTFIGPASPNPPAAPKSAPTAPPAGSPSSAPSAAPPTAAPSPVTPPAPAAVPKAPAVPSAESPSHPGQGRQRGSLVFTGPLEVVAVATDRAWVRVVADGVTVFDGFLSAGTREVWNARHEITLKVGNASGLDVSVNGRPLGPLGNPGDVIDRTFTSQESVTP